MAAGRVPVAVIFISDGGNILRQIIMEQDDESVVVHVEMPQQQRNRVTTVISTWQFSHSAEDPHGIKLFMCVSEIYLRNLIDHREEFSFKDEQRRRVPAETILVEQFVCYLKGPDGKQELAIECSGDLLLVFFKYRGLELVVQFKQQFFGADDYLVARFQLGGGGGEEPRPRTMKLQARGENTWFCLIDSYDIDTFLKGRLAVEVVAEKQNVQESRFVGIRNEGNTCYMNSVLQILYFIRVLRKNLVDYKGEGRVMGALREVFLKLMDGPQSRSGPVDADALIQAYGRFAEYPRRQQDTQQFLLGFLEQLQGECPSLAGLWQGESYQVLRSIEEDKPYHSTVKQDFSGLDLPLQDLKGNTFQNLIESLKHLVQSEDVDDKIETDDYGKVTVQKNRQFIKLPPVLFLTLKRYQFKKSATRPTKILADLHYPSQIDLSFLLATPPGGLQYQLFAVIVHRGQHYSSGHYYSFVNTSPHLGEPCWVKFDDSRVVLASESQALSFSGGKHFTTVWNKDFQRFMEKEYLAEDTGYVLVYIRQEYFKEWQTVQTQVPREWLNEKRKVRVREQVEQKGLQQVQVLVGVLNNELDLFGNVQTIAIGLNPHEDVVTQLSNLDYGLLGCRVGTVWKVNKAAGKVKKLVEFADLLQTPAKVFEQKRGHRVPDYLLILPEKETVYQRATSVVGAGRLGLVRMEVNGEYVWRLIRKDALEDLMGEEEQRLERKAHVVDKESFLYDWNDYCAMIFE